MSNTLFGLYVISTLIYNVTSIDYLFYLAFMYALCVCIKKYNKTRDDLYLVEFVLYSIIMPSNYIVLFALLIIMVLKAPRIKRTKGSVGLFIFLLYLGLNSIVNKLLPINTIFYVLYTIPLPICAFLFSILKVDFSNDERFIRFLKKILQIQGIGIGTYPIFNLKEVIKSIDFDWVTGSFGNYQGNIFFFFCAFCFVFFLDQYTRHHKNLKYLLLSGIFMIMTGSIALIVLFALSVILYLFLSWKIKVKTKFKIVAMMSVAICFFIIVTPTWIKSYMIRMATEPDKSVYISKINDYNNVFFNTRNPIGFELFGTGVGKYSSRAALTCTGVYIKSYNSLFDPSISEYTSKYIYNKLCYVYENRMGIVDAPWAEYISVKGELGAVGILFLILFFVSLLHKSKGWGKGYVIFVILACFTENYLEFAKIVLVLYLSIALFSTRKNRTKIIGRVSKATGGKQENE